MSTSRHGVFNQPLISYAPAATWKFHNSDGVLSDTLYQFGPSLVHPQEVVDYVLEAHSYRTGDLARTLVHVPGEPSAQPAYRDRARDVNNEHLSAAPPTDLTARAFWTFWGEVYTVSEIMSQPRLSQTRWRKPGFVWSVYPTLTGELDGAFVAYDHKGQPNPVFTFERRPFAELAAALTTTDRINEFLENF